MKIKKRYGLIIKLISFFLIIIIEANGQKALGVTVKNGSAYQNQTESETTLDKVDIIIAFGKKYLGKPYQYKVNDKMVLDCSGLIKYIHGQNGVNLPRTADAISKVSKKVNLSEIKKGDLIFFKGRDINSKKVKHLSLVTSVDGDIIKMMHSCNRGIIEEEYNSIKYYVSRFLFVGRLPQLDSIKPLIIESTELISDSTQINTNQNEIIKNDSLVKNTEPKSVKIIGVGDIMLGTNFPNSSYLPPNDGKNILDPVKKIISKGDVSFGNLEGVLLTSKGNVKKCSNPKVCYAFKMPEHYVNYLKEAGFNLLSLANNHSRDFGNVGTANTIRVLKEAGIPHAGLKDCPFTTFTKNSITYGFAAFSPNTGTIKINNYAYARKIISHLDTVCDIVIVSFHGGAEGSKKNHITRKKEMFLGEDRGNPYEFARVSIDAGADIIFGHGPHVTRAIDIYKDRFIAYSLGNFATYARFNLSGPNGISPIVELDVDTNGKFIKGKIHSIKQIGNGGPIIDKNGGALKEIINLNKIDIPECKLKIENDKSISKKVE